MRKIFKGKRFIVVFVIILVAFITKTCVYDKSEDKQEVSQKEIEEKLIDKSVEAKRVKESISKEIEIVVLKEKGNLELFHDKTPENNKYIEWIINSNITIKIYYTAILTIDTESIEVIYNEITDEIEITYDNDKIQVDLVNIDNILSKTSKGLFGKRYSEKEMTALTLVSTDKIKEEISKDEDIKYLATVNLEKYLINMSHKLGVYNIKIIQK